MTSFLSASTQKGEVPYQEVRRFEILLSLIDYRGEKHVIVKIEVQESNTDA